jgi:hypothetical protein
MPESLDTRFRQFPSQVPPYRVSVRQIIVAEGLLQKGSSTLTICKWYITTANTVAAK